MSSSSATAEAAVTIAASGNLSGKRTVMKVELEEKLAKGRQTPEGKLDELSEKEKKQIIHENLLAARMRWIKKAEAAESAATPVSSSAGGSDESEDEEPQIEQRGITQSLEPTANTKIERLDKIQLRANRAYSNNSFPQRMITKPPKNPPPSLTNPAGISSTVSVGEKAKTEKKETKSDGARKHSSDNSAATSKVKKIFTNFKPKKKKKKRRTVKMTSIPPTSDEYIKGEKTRKIGEYQNAGRLAATHKSMSDSHLLKQNVSMSISSLDEESSLPIHIPSLGYQNVFDNPDFAKYIQKPPSRSNSSSPAETPQQMKKPKPLPRPSASASSLGMTTNISTGSERDTDLETPPPLQSRITVISPLMSNSPNSAHSDSLTPVFMSPQLIEEDASFCLEQRQPHKNSSSMEETGNMKQRLGKTVSCNPDAGESVLKRRGSSQKQKEFRRGVCSEGPLEEEYIRMNSISDSTLESKPQLVNEFLSVNNLEAPRNSQRLSAAYLKLLPDLLGPVKEPSMHSSEEKSKTARSKPQLQKVKTVPSLGVHGLKGNSSSLTLGSAHYEDKPLSKDGHHSYPQSSSDCSQKQDMVEPAPTPSKRKFQYTAVTIEAAGKQRKPSAPKKFKYQTVTLNDNGEIAMMPNEEERETAKEQPPSTEQVSEVRKTSEQQLHPLLIPSPAGMQSPLDSGNERRYYINRDSIRVVKNPKDLPTTMLKTVDPGTGKVIWHEYVEIDEGEIDQIASSMGVSPSNIQPEPQENLQVLLSMKPEEDKLESEEAALIQEMADNGSATPEGVIEDSDLSCSSTVSSECKYILNLDDPPTIPPRPAVLDEIADDEEFRSSGDYSYAFIPGVGARWMFLGGHVSPKSFLPAAKDLCTISEKTTGNNATSETSTVQTRVFSSTSLKQQQKLRPPSLPPKTDSLLREAELIKPSKKGKTTPFLPPIIVRTKKSKHPKGNPAHPFEASTASPQQQTIPEVSSEHDSRIRKRSAPPKVTPYKEYQERKRYSGPQQIPAELAFSSSHESIPTITLSPDIMIKHEGQEAKKHATVKSHKKLARQRSHGRRSYRKRKSEPKKQHLQHQGSQENEMPLTQSEGSVGNSVEMQEALVKGVLNTEEEKESAEIETEEAKRARALNKILVELGHLLKNSNFSEADLLGAIESHLKSSIKTSTISEETEQEEKEGSEEDFTNEHDEPESWLSGEEPESEIELEDTSALDSCHSKLPYVNLHVGENETEVMNDNEDIDKNEELDYEEMSSFVLGDDHSDDEDSPTHSYVNLEFGSEMKIYEHDESKRYSYVDLDIESNLDIPSRIRTPSPVSSRKYIPSSGVESSQQSHKLTSKPILDDSTASSPVALHRERSKSSAVSKVRRNLIKPRSSRTHSNPDPDLADAVVAAVGNYPRNSAVLQPTPRKNKTCSNVPMQKLTHEMTSLHLAGATSERSSSYQLALQMEDTHLSQSAEVSTSRKRLSAVREEGTHCKDIDYCSKSLQRANAVVTKKRQKGIVNSNTGSGVFFYKGGKLTKIGSDVTIEVPEGAVPEGRSQKIWFKVIQRVYDPSADEDPLSLSLSDSISTSQVESLLQEKREKQVQLSPMIVVGPHDAILEKPIIIRMPHCLPYRNNSWHLQMLGRPSYDGGSEEWLDIANTIGLVQRPPVKSKSKFQNRSSYQMHLDYVQVKTSQLGTFKLVGRPICNGTYAGKKMVSSVYAKALPESKSLQIDIFMNNAIEDQAQALDDALTRHAHIPLMRDMPILCFGDGKDMEVTLSNDSNTAIPLGTKSIAFGQFWRSNRVGSSHVMFKVEEDLVEDDRALTLKVQQAGSKLYHETNFLLPDSIL